MLRMKAPVLLLGSVPLETAREAMRLCAQELAGGIDCLTDGETGFRKEFIQGMALTTFYGHPDLDAIQRPTQGWRPANYKDLWKFRVRAAVKLRLDHLQFAADAIKSYDDFCALRRDGLIGSNVRFMVALPLTDTGTMPFGVTWDDCAKLYDAFQEALIREIQRIADNIPPNELCIQWDCPVETINLATGYRAPAGGGEAPKSPPLERFANSLQLVAAAVPDPALIGVHLCYGDLGGRHVVEPTDLGDCVAMANAASARVRRPIDYFHFPVPIDRADEPYFRPLTGLNTPKARLYLGLIHEKDGLEGAIKRARAARKFVSAFGVSTECGLGRRRPEILPTLLKLHREAASAVEQLC